VLFDPGNASHVVADERLRSGTVIWLTTVRPDGTPQTSPVWFLWDGATFLVYSMPSSPKVSNIVAHAGVAMNLDSDGAGGGIVTLEGTAEVVGSVDSQAYLQKYDRLIRDLGYTAAQFAGAYSTAIRVTPSRVRVY
jgi:PPOX class probable F420-dependent enzyme